MQSIRRFLRFFFRHFYHGFAWAYDFVAAFVSIGRWNDWVDCALPYVQGHRVLELGHGPGHLQKLLRSEHTGLVAGLDESSQMGLLAKKRLLKAGYPNINLTRSIAQSLPFAEAAFDVVVSTFPAEYIFEKETMIEVRRVLCRGGRFIVLPAAWIIGQKMLDRSAAWLFRATDQAPKFAPTVLSERLRGAFDEGGFTPEFQTVQIRSSVVLVIIAQA